MNIHQAGILVAASLVLAACQTPNSDSAAVTTTAVSIYNPEAVIPPQCYTKTESRFNPCYTCHQSHLVGSRPNMMQDGVLQGEYTFTKTAQTNHWLNLFRDRNAAVAAMSDQSILDYIAEDNYTPLLSRLQASGWAGYLPDLANLQRGAVAFDSEGFALDGSGWVAFNYKPLSSTFWPTNGSTDDVFVRLPPAFRNNSDGNYSKAIYQINLAIVEAAIKDLVSISIPNIDENTLGMDINGDGVWSVVNSLPRPGNYLGGAATTTVSTSLYPLGTEFLHSVRYIGVSNDGTIYAPARMKELRYMRKIRFYSAEALASRYETEHQDRIDGLLPNYVSAGDWGLDNGFGWQVSGFIEDNSGALRPQGREETLFCMGCHSTLGSTIDQSFAFPRKVTGAAGWGYIDLKGMADVPTVGDSEGEILRYLRLVGGGDEFRQNSEMLERYFNSDGSVNTAVVEAADVYTLITPSRDRALSLNKAYRLIVQEQSFTHGRDATITPAQNVYQQVAPAAITPLPQDKQVQGDIRLQW